MKEMTVGELIELLKIFPQDRPVAINYDGHHCRLTPSKIVNSDNDNLLWLCHDEPDAKEIRWLKSEPPYSS